jgi:hypothetical protein
MRFDEVDEMQTYVIYARDNLALNAARITLDARQGQLRSVFWRNHHPPWLLTSGAQDRTGLPSLHQIHACNDLAIEENQQAI